jgi:hypothetical protein
MGRAAFFGLFLFSAAGCITTPEPNRPPIQPLPADGAAMSYKEVMIRARALASTANEAFYIDQWAEVEKAAANLEETAQYIPRSTEIPVARKVSLEARSQDLVKAAQSLRSAAKAKDEKKTNETMQRINLLVRELRPD